MTRTKLTGQTLRRKFGDKGQDSRISTIEPSRNREVQRRHNNHLNREKTIILSY